MASDFTYRNSVIRIVEDDFNVGGQDSGSSTFVQKRLSLLGTQMGEFVAQHELDGEKEITLSRSISSDDNIVPFVKRFNNSLLAVALKALNNNLWKNTIKLLFC